MAKALVQQNAGGVADGGTLAFSSNITSGNGLFALIALASGSATVNGITDTRGNTWSVVVRRQFAGSTARTVEIWKAPAGASGACTLTFDWSAAVNGQVTISEWSGFTNGITTDATDSADTNDTLQTSHVCGATGVLTTSDSLVLGVIAIPTSFTITGRDPGWNALTAGGARSDMQYKIATSAATEDATTTTSGTCRSVGAIASFSQTAGGGTHYTLTADAGTYTQTGSAATVKAARKVTADAGSYALSGTAAALMRGYVLAADSGSYAVSGVVAALTATRTLTAAAGSYSLSGTDAAVLKGYLASAVQGAYTLTGEDATLTHGQPGAFTLDADAGSYSLAGASATLLVTRKLTADAGAYAWTGAAAAVVFGRRISAEAGSYAWSGQDTTVRAARALTAASGPYAWTGTAVTLSYSEEVSTLSRIRLTGSYVPSLSLTGSYRPSISLTGSIE